MIFYHNYINNSIKKYLYKALYKKEPFRALYYKVYVIVVVPLVTVPLLISEE